MSKYANLQRKEKNMKKSENEIIELNEAKAALSKLPKRRKVYRTKRERAASDEYKRKYKELKRLYHIKPKAERIVLPERKCLGRGYLGGGCGKMFTPDHKGNHVGPCCTVYLQRYG